jgi:fucose permease
VILHLIIWLVKSTIVDALAVSFVGVLYGPIFPACLAMANDILPEDVQMVAMALM